jgi:glutamate-1-semialdehyde 2,1-aminomutase
MVVRTALTQSKLYEKYVARTPGSARRHQRALELFPSGVTHHGRFLKPYPLYVERAAASRKWDIDSNEYVDYFGGHGSLILGHGHPEVVEAVARQVGRGTHYGAQHELELEWAELIHELVPSAEKIRFTSSGTEATHLALRLARAFTGKPKFVRFAGHFHGWHDHVAFSSSSGPEPAGIPASLVGEVIIVPPNDEQAIGAVLQNRDDVAAVILEPTGASFGHVPTGGETLRALRELTQRRGVVLIFDEVVTGFRCALGGAQAHYQVTPDLTTLAKVVAGGYPGAAVVGRAEILRLMDWNEGPGGVSSPALPHQGTFNANPVAAVAGATTLRLLKSGGYIDQANRQAAAIRDGLNAILAKLGSSWCVYGDFSGFHVFTNPARAAVTPEDIHKGRVSWETLKNATPPELSHKVRIGMLAEGVDWVGWPGGVVSGVHTDEDVEKTLDAFEQVAQVLAEEGDLG